jgi:glycine/D-amino acid oxidase-like deaminating enzyme
MAATNNLDEAKISRGDVCEAVVVGAGPVGAAMVANLAAEGLEVAMFEAKNLVGGSGRGPVPVFTGLPSLYVQAVERYGRETARALWQLTRENRDSVLSACDRLGVTAERSGSYLLVDDDAQAELLRESADLLIEDGFEAYFEPDDPLDRGFAAALHRPDDLLVDTSALTMRLLDANKAPVHMGSEVHSLRQAGEGVIVLARDRAIKATTVVLAVNGYAPLIDGYFADKVAPVRELTLTTRPLDEELVAKPSTSGLISFHQTLDRRLRFSIWPDQYQTPPARPSDDSAEIDLMRFVGLHFPDVRDAFTQRESSITAVSRDAFPLIGALPHLPQVFFAVGFAGYGLSLAFAAAELLTGLIVRGAEPELFSARRLE